MVSIANSEFYRLLSTVLGGLQSIVTNFLGVASQLSGPVAIVAAGSEIARSDSAGLYQVHVCPVCLLLPRILCWVLGVDKGSGCSPVQFFV